MSRTNSPKHIRVWIMGLIFLLLMTGIRKFIILQYEFAELGRQPAGFVEPVEGWVSFFKNNRLLSSTGGEYILQTFFIGFFLVTYLSFFKWVIRRALLRKIVLIIYPGVIVISLILFNIGLSFSLPAWINTAKRLVVLLQGPSLFVLMAVGELFLTQNANHNEPTG